MWYCRSLWQLQIFVHIVLVLTWRWHLCPGFLGLAQVACLLLFADRILSTRTAPIISQIFPFSVCLFVVQRARTVVPLCRLSELLWRLVAVKIGTWTSLNATLDFIGYSIVLAGARSLRSLKESEVHRLTLGRLVIIITNDLLLSLVLVVSWTFKSAFALLDVIHEACLVHSVPLVSLGCMQLGVIKGKLGLVIWRSRTTPTRFLRLVHDLWQVRSLRLLVLWLINLPMHSVKMHISCVRHVIPHSDSIVLRLSCRHNHISDLQLAELITRFASKSFFRQYTVINIQLWGGDTTRVNDFRPNWV